MNDYLTEAELATLLSATEAQIATWRKRYDWPHFKIGRQVRFTLADVRAIESMHRAKPRGVDALPGQTGRSAARSA